jgi:hypothetical protein
MPTVAGTLGAIFTLSCSGISDLLGAVEHEAQARPLGKGIVHLYGSPNSAGAIPADRAGQISQNELISHRKELFQQHEANFLAYAALCGIEQLLRGLARANAS